MSTLTLSRIVTWSALALACGCQARAPDAAQSADSAVSLSHDDASALPAPPLPEWSAADSVGPLAAAAAGSWRLTPLAHAPNHLALAGWKDPSTLWGVAGCNPVEVSVESPAVQAWNVEACGGIEPEPNGPRLVWGTGQGGMLLLGARGGEQRVLRASGAPSPLGEGDPAGAVFWSPNGSRVLVSWAAEWDASYATIDVTSGATTPVRTQKDGYFLTEAFGWLDDDRLLFVAQANKDRGGRSEYSESGGYRADLFLYDVRDSSYTALTSVDDGVMLRPLAPWSEGEVLVGERPRGATRFEAYWAYDPGGGSRRPVLLPSATDVRVFAPEQVLLLDRTGDRAGPPHDRIFLWRGEGQPVLPLTEIREGQVEWSLDGSRIALTSSVDEPVAGMPGSFRTRRLAYVLEPR